MKWVVSRSWVRYGVWVMVGLWLKWVVGRWRLPVFMSSEVMVRLAWVTTWLAGSSRFCLSDGYFFYIYFNMGFVLVGFWWAVGSGGVVGMVEVWWW